jgi:hypothetical protein
MSSGDLRAKIRDLMAAGVLPSEPAPIQRPVPPTPMGPNFVRGCLLDQPCDICGGLAPEVQHFYVGGIVVRVHAACDELWKQEQGG